jgi:hypothetical protein
MQIPVQLVPGSGGISPGVRRTAMPSRSRSRSYFTTDSQSVSQYILLSSTLVGLATRYYFLSECCCLKFAVLYLLAALSDKIDKTAICSVITQYSESPRTRNHILLSHLRLPQPGGTGPCIYIAFRNRMVQSKVKSMSKSKSCYDRRPVNQYVLVPSPLGTKRVPS